MDVVVRVGRRGDVGGGEGGVGGGVFFFFNDTATTEIYTLSLHDALPICLVALLTEDRRTRNFVESSSPSSEHDFDVSTCERAVYWCLIKHMMAVHHGASNSTNFSPGE